MLDIRALFVRMDAYASRFDSAGKPQHAETIRGWMEEIKALTEKDAAKNLADAEVERARGIAASNKIIADGLGGPEGYLRWLWIDALREGKEGNTIIYIPTEAGLPVLEANRFATQKGIAPK